MAKIKYTDFYNQESFDAAFNGIVLQLQKIQSESKKVATELAKVFKVVTYKESGDLKTHENLIKGITQATVSHNEARKQEIILEQTKIKLDIEKQKNINSLAAAEQKRANEQKKAEAAAQKQIEKEKQLEVALTQEANSIEKLRQKTNAMVSQRDKMIVNTEKDAAARKKLTEQIAANTVKLKAFDEEIGRSQRNVGNYPKTIQSIGDSFKSAFAAFTVGGLIASAITSTIQGLKTFLKEAGTIFLDAEEKIQKLEFAVLKVGGGSNSSFKKLTAQAEELMGVFDDEAISESQTDLVNYGLTAQQVYDLIPTLIDAAAQSGRELTEVTNAVIKGIEGQAKGLKTLGVDFEDTGTAAGNLATIQEQLAKFTGGAADAMTTEAGQVKFLTNQIEESSEAVGQYTAKMSLYWKSFRNDFVEAILGIFDVIDKKKAFEVQVETKTTTRLSEAVKQVAIEAKETGTDLLVKGKESAEWYLQQADIAEAKFIAAYKKAGYENEAEFMKAIGSYNPWESAKFIQAKVNYKDYLSLLGVSYQLNEAVLVYREEQEAALELTKKTTDAAKETTVEKAKEIDAYTDLEKILNQYKLRIIEINDSEDTQSKILSARIEYLQSIIDIQEDLTKGTIQAAEASDLLEQADLKLTLTLRDLNDATFDFSENIEAAIKKVTDDAEAEAKRLKEAEEDFLDAIQDTTEKVIESYIERSQAKQEALEDDLSNSKEYEDQLRELAKTGIEEADNNLAYEQRKQAEIEKKKEKELKKQKRLELGLAAVTGYSNLAKKDEPNALTKTITEIIKLMAFVNSIPEFEEGIIAFGGKKKFSQPDDTMAKIGKGESVITAPATYKYYEQLKDMQALRYNPADYLDIPKFSQPTTTATDKALLNEVKEMNQSVKNIPGYQIDVNLLTHEIIERVTKGNNTTINIHKPKGLF
jgi:hypothetical protein